MALSLLQEAVKHLKRLTDREPCSHINGRIGTRFESMTCRDYMTQMQGVPHPGCAICQAKEFLDKLESEVIPVETDTTETPVAVTRDP
jgi:hypothetical protein